MLNRRMFLKTTGALSASLLSGCSNNAVSAFGKTEKPNILLIMSDDHAAHAISAYGSKVNKTPNIDRIAKNGILFKNCFCTNSICAPSRAVILTGKYNHINGMVDNRQDRVFDGSQQTFPKLLQKGGYETAVIGKWHLVSNPTGFDFWKVLPGQGSYYNPDFTEQDGTKKQYEGYCTDLITEFSLDWLENQRDKSKPFMLMCHHKASHRNWTPHPRHFSMYKLGTIPESPTLFADLSKRSTASTDSKITIKDHFQWSHDMKFHGDNLFPEHFLGRMKNSEYNRMTPEQKKQWDAFYEPENKAFIEQMSAGKLTDDDVVRWKYQRYMSDYLRTLQCVDDGVGQLLDYLDNKGLAHNTIVIYASDQGVFLGDDGLYDKRFMYEPSLRMPLLMSWPQKIKPRSTSEQMVLNLDFAPTLLQCAAQDIPGDIQGESFVPVLQGKKPARWRNAMYYHYYEYPTIVNVRRHYGVRTEQYKLIHFYSNTDVWELYDLQKDPYELNNLYGDPQYAQIVEKLKLQLKQLRNQYGDSDELTASLLKKDPTFRKKANDRN